MSPGVTDLISRFGALRMLVVGDAILDSYLDGAATRLCREAPVPIVDVTVRGDAPGGAANTAANARALGASVRLISITGDDGEARVLRETLERLGVEAAGLIPVPGRRTLAKTRVLASGHMMLRFDQGDGGAVDAATERRIVAALEEEFARADAVIVSDYGYGVVTPRLVERLIRLQAESPRIVLVDARDLLRFRGLAITAIKPNFQEAIRLIGPRALAPDRDRAEAVAPHAARLLDMVGAQIAAITLDTDGALVVERGRAAYRTYAKPARHARAAGAGDTFAATFALALAAGGHTPAAAELASSAAAIVVAQDGTSVCGPRELAEHFGPGDKYLGGLDDLAARVAYHRQQGRRVVFTNGCFDILHRGHITYLNRAKALGDLLVVGLNSDASVRRLKGEGRPINALDDRVQVLAALSCIDHIVPFDDDTPAALIAAIRPDVFVKGGDYTRDTLPEAPLVESLGGIVHLLPLVEDRSTTGIIERVRSSAPAPRASRSAGR